MSAKFESGESSLAQGSPYWWLLIDFALPSLIALVPVGIAMLLGLSFPFVRALHSGDLLPIGSIMCVSLLASIIDLFNEATASQVAERKRLSAWLVGTLVLFAVTMISFVALKFHSMLPTTSIPALEGSGVPMATFVCSAFSLMILVLTFAYCFWARSQAESIVVSKT